MVDAFATADDLAVRLNRTFTGDEETWIETLLEDASTYLRGVIGYDIVPRTQSSYTAYPDCGRIDLPQVPVASVDSVQRDGKDAIYDYRPYYLEVAGDDPVDVTFTWGLDVVPPELTRLACVLVSGALLTLEANIGLTAGGLSSVALDDFKLAWADAGASSGMALPAIQEDAVRSRFGKGDAAVVSLR